MSELEAEAVKQGLVSTLWLLSVLVGNPKEPWLAIDISVQGQNKIGIDDCEQSTV